MFSADWWPTPRWTTRSCVRSNKVLPMQIRQLQYFIAVAQSGSFSQAAADLFMTQPPLSAAISQLEKELGSQLLVRHARGVSLTATGNEVLRYAERLVLQQKDLVRRVHALEGGKAGSLIIGYSPVLAATHLSRILEELSEAPSALDISIQEADPLRVIEAVANSTVDVGLVATASSDDIRSLYQPRLDVEELGELPMLAALPPRWKAQPKAIPLREVADRSFAVPAQSMRQGVRLELISAFERAGLTPPRIREVPNFREAITLVSSGIAVAVVPESMRASINPDRVTFQPLKDGPRPLSISLVSRRENEQSSPVRRFQSVARSVSSNIG